MSAGMDNQMHTLTASDSPSDTVSALWGALPYLSYSLLYPPHLRYLGPSSMEIKEWVTLSYSLLRGLELSGT